MTPEQEAAIAAAKARRAAKPSGMTPEQQAAVEAVQARRKGKPAETPEYAPNGAPMNAAAKAEIMAKAKAGDLEISPERIDQQAAIDAQNAPRNVGQALYDNLIGDPRDGVDSFGERLGRGVNDVAKAGGAGVARGVAGLVGLPGMVSDVFDAGMTKGGKALGIIPQEWSGPSPSPLSSGALVDDLSQVTDGATDYRGDSRAARFAGTVGEFLPGAAAFGGMSPSNLARFGVIPGATSEAAGQATEGTGWEPVARVAGALAGGILPGLAAKGAAKLVSPYGGADPERLKLAGVLDDFGVPISAGQRVGSEAMRRKEGLTGAGQRLSEAQREAFTKAALKTAGTDATRATPEVLAETAARIGAVFDDVVKGIDITPDSASVSALADAVSVYKNLAPTGNQAPLVSNILKETTKFFRGGNAVPASTVNTWRSGLSKLTASADAATREAATKALEAVDDMLTGALNAAGRADDVARLATARGEWRNFLAIQKAATSAGESAAAGLLSPSALRNSVVQQGRTAFAQGRRGDLGDLARAGEGVMKQLPDSGTPGGIRAMLPGGLSGSLGAAIGSSIGPWGAAAGAMAGMALPGVAGAIRMTSPMQAYLANQVAGGVAARVGAGAGTALLPFADDAPNALRDFIRY